MPSNIKAFALFTVLGLLSQSLSASSDGHCESLVGVAASDTIISSATVMAGDDVLPPHCIVRGVIEPRIGAGGKQYGTGFELRMPDNWSGRFLMQGGGGFDGTVNPAVGMNSADRDNPALARGFAVASTDAGHYGDDARDAWWGKDIKARHDNGYNSVKLVTERSRAIIERFYGALPARSYFMGCSNGGRQGMVAATRYPEYYDGVLAAAPAFDIPSSIVAWNWNSRVLKALADAERNGDVAATFSDAELTMISTAAIHACDEADGVNDNLVMAPMQCRFDPAQLQCKAGASEACLSNGQVEALKKIQEGPRDSAGNLIYAGWDLAGIDGPTGFRLWEIGAISGPRPSSAGADFQDGFLKNIAHTPPNPAYDSMSFQVDDRKMLAEAAPIWSATSTDYGDFSAKGGKIIIWHGTADGAFSTAHLVNWYNTLQQASGGAEATAKFARLYLTPGVHHCSGGQGLTNFDALSPLIDWVENDVAPGPIQATGTPPGHTEPVTRPLCAYPGITTKNEKGEFICR